ncbi:unnamed protein product [Pleuronectes platessa]|uniref:Uncharacterized protein n=1 Tax=Pleuronectes platessa TaxID=8262 RepID=A0A9N7UTN5_PLEPL|nr:unnamed protein product [Pleuronectes platessa]
MCGATDSDTCVLAHRSFSARLKAALEELSPTGTTASIKHSGLSFHTSAETGRKPSELPVTDDDLASRLRHTDDSGFPSVRVKCERFCGEPAALHALQTLNSQSQRRGRVETL